LKVLTNSDAVAELWKAEGASIVNSAAAQSIDLVHVASDKLVDSLFLKNPVGPEGDILENMKLLITMRHAMRRKIPLIATGRASQLLTAILGHAVVTGARVVASVVRLSQGAYFLDDDDKEYLKSYKAFSVTMSKEYSLAIKHGCTTVAHSILENSSCSLVHGLYFPQYNAVAYQPEPEKESKSSDARTFFLDIQELTKGQ
jgi:hypothetical protein